MFPLQPLLYDSLVRVEPLTNGHFEELYQVASDPLVWEQHPNPDRYKREIFKVYFDGAMLSGGAFIVRDVLTDEAIGSSRFYDYNEKGSEIKIGYTFLARRCWGGVYNRRLKSLMLAHAFSFVERVIFHIGAHNIRSQKAMERIGGKKTGEENICYHGEQHSLNLVYVIDKRTVLS